RVFRLRVRSDGRACSLVLKRFDPWLARRNELVVRRWLPAIGLGDRCPKLLATAADRRGAWVWHVYEDLGDGAVDAGHPDPAGPTPCSTGTSGPRTRSSPGPATTSWRG